MKNYELMFIVKPTLDDEAANAVCENMKSALEKEGAKILEVKPMGHKELAYEVAKFKTGNYFLITVESEKEAINEFSRLANISEDIIRHIVVKAN